MNNRTTKKSGTKPDVYQIVTNRIISLLEAGTPPWRRTWGQYGLARNYISGHIYTGINMVILNLVAPYPIPYYLTWNQIKKREGTIKKGSKAEWVYFYKEYFKDKNGKGIPQEQAEQMEDSQTVRFLKPHKVFNIDCIEGIEFELPEEKGRDNTTIENCEELIQSMKEQPEFIVNGCERAFYNPTQDRIHVPKIEKFESSEEFYNTTFHEITHWTGHGERLARPAFIDVKIIFGSDLYSEEELVAEMGASYLCALTGIDRESLIENNAAYIQGWLKKLRSDNRLVFRAASAAQKAVNYIVGKVA